jgi:hypothetical protein
MTNANPFAELGHTKPMGKRESVAGRTEDVRKGATSLR